MHRLIYVFSAHNALFLLDMFQLCLKVNQIYPKYLDTWTIYHTCPIGLDKSGYQVNTFLISL